MSARLRTLLAAGALAACALLAVACGSGSGGSTSAENVQLPPLPKQRPLLGFNEQILPDNAENPLLRQSGASFIRTPLVWATAERTEGKVDFTPFDQIYELLAKSGLRPLWVVTSAPCWAADAPCSGPQRPSLAPTPEHVGQFADFVAQVAQHYPDSLGIEVWNEPNIPNFWRPKPDPQLYRKLLAAAADAVHASGSKVPVVAAGPSPTTADQVAKDPDKIGFVPFIKEVMKGPDAPDVDAIGLHPYSLLQVGKDPVTESIKLYDQGKEAAAAVAPDVPVWVTEVGLTTAGQYAISESEQASGLERIVKDFAGDGVPVVTIHRFFDQADSPLRFERGFGVVASDQTTPKPSFCSPADAIGLPCHS